MIEWGNAPAWAGVLIGLGTVGLGWRSVRQARSLQDEQARPYVVAYMEPTGNGPHLHDLVVKNLGKTAAHDVRVAATPALTRAVMGMADVAVPDVIPTLVPGQEWRTLWDSSAYRFEHADLPRRYDVIVNYRDSSEHPLSTPSVLDWDTVFGRLTVTPYTIDEAAHALEKIEKHMKGWNESIHGGLQVFSRDADAMDEAKAERRQRQLSEQRRRQEREPT